MHERNQVDRLTGRVELDDTYLGRERPGKRRYGAEHKFPFVAALQTDEEGHRLRVQLSRVSGLILNEIRHYAQQTTAPGSQVISECLRCFRAFGTLLYVHICHITGGGHASVENSEFNWVNTLLGNFKNVITGTYHAIRGQHVPRDLAEFEYRFNRRYDLKVMIQRFRPVAAKTPTMPYRFLNMADTYA